MLRNKGEFSSYEVELLQPDGKTIPCSFHAMEKKVGIFTISMHEKELPEDKVQNEIGVEAGCYVAISVEDTGPGIQSDIQEKIFDPYFSTKEVGKGTGMGLSIIHGIAKRSNGFIFLQSEVGKGSIFNVYFPVVNEKKFQQADILEDKTKKE